MKAIKKIAAGIIAASATIILGMTASAEGGVAINETNFPDEAFRNYVIEHADFDKNHLLSSNEIKIVTDIDVDNLGIKSLNGIEYFTDLKLLQCIGNNQLESIDLSHNAYLEKLYCQKSGLKELNLSKNVLLDTLNCQECNLTSIDIDECTSLKYIYCSNNQLTELDASGCASLVTLECNNNKIKNLDLSKNNAIRWVECSGNQMTNLNLSGCSSLISLDCSNNLIGTININSSTDLTSLICKDNNITNLNLGNNIALEKLYCENNQLSDIDVSKNTALKYLQLSGNKLTDPFIDLSQNASLERFEYNYDTINAILSENKIDMSVYKHLDTARVTLLSSGVKWDSENAAFICIAQSLIKFRYNLSKDISRDFYISIANFPSQAIIGLTEDSKKIYNLGEELDLTMSLNDYNEETGEWSVFTKFKLTPDMVSGYDKNSAGNQTIAISYISSDWKIEVTVLGEDTFDITDEVGNYGAAVIDIDEKTINTALNDEDKKAEHIKFAVSEKNPTDTVKAMIKDKVTTNTELVYLDIELKKYVNGVESDIAETAKPVKVKLELPADLKKSTASDKARNYSIVRVHDGVAEILDATFDGTYLTFETDKFSDYAIAYTDLAYGDVNGDGSVTLHDLLRLGKNIAGIEGTFIYKAAADVNADGKVTLHDLLRLGKSIAGIEGVILGQA